ncbi:MAG: peptidase S41, partial [Acidobacteriota bacterium]
MGLLRRVLGILSLLPALVAVEAAAGIDARLLRYPDVSASQIAFVYAGDIWLVAKEGGVAQRLSTPKGEEMFPRFSPDGTTLGFSANYDGNLDLYSLPVAGGVPSRITYHPASDRMLDWYPGGQKILFASSMTSGKDRFNQLWKVGSSGGLPERLPLPYGEFGALSADGKTLAYVPIATDFRTWKRYRGGMAPELWLFDLEKTTARKIAPSDAMDGQPMWHGSTLYFLSDRDAAKRGNIWAFDLASEKLHQVTFFDEYDVRFPAIGPRDIVFEAAGRLWLLDLATEKYREVKVEVVTDRATLKPHTVNVAKLIANAEVSPAGKRAFIEARGEIFSLPAEHGVTLNLTHSSGTAERFPAASPDGKLIAYFSDRSGEYELTVRPADGSGEERTVTSLGQGFRYRPSWSPDSTKIAFIDKAMAIQVCDLASGKVTQIDKALYFYEGNLQGFTASWSADSRWLAYARDLDSRQSAIFLHDTKAGKTTQVTSGYYNDLFPAFDPDGKYLYLATNRTFKPVYSDVDTTWIYPNTTSIAAIPLRHDVASPLGPRNDVEGEEKKDEKDKADDKAKDDTDKKKDAEKKGDKAEADEKEKKEPPKPVEIGLDGFEQRLVLLPAEAGNYAAIAAIPGKVLYLRLPRTGASDEKKALLYFDLEERVEKTIAGDVDGFVLAAGGKKLL